MCQTIIRGPASPLVKKLAYDVVHAAPLSDEDWSLVIEGLRSDIVGTFSLEVTFLSAFPSLFPQNIDNLRVFTNCSLLLAFVLSLG